MDYPPGFTPEAFWFFPDWGEPDYASKLGYKEPFWVKDARKTPSNPAREEQKPLPGPKGPPGIFNVSRAQDDLIYNPATDMWIKRFICFHCGRRHEISYSKWCVDQGMHLNLEPYTCSICKSDLRTEKMIQESIKMTSNTPITSAISEYCCNCGTDITGKPRQYTYPFDPKWLVCTDCVQKAGSVALVPAIKRRNGTRLHS